MSPHPMDTIRARANRASWTWACAALAFAVASASIAGATERLSPRIRMATENATPAVSRAEYGGTILITAARNGVLDAVTVGGVGWEQRSIGLDQPRPMSRGETVSIPFEAFVQDAGRLIEISAQFDGIWTRKRLDLSPERFARAGRDYMAIRRSDSPTSLSADSAGADEAGRIRNCSDQEIRFRGRIVYERPAIPGIDNSIPPDGDFDDPGDVPPRPAAIIGVDRILYEVMDDDIIDEAIHSGYTDENGYFDVTVCWDDCDISGCDDPDIYLRFECDTDVVNVQDGYNILEPDYSWSTEDTQYYPDYTGHDIDFGVVQSADPGLNPALHIHNTITRAHRFIIEHEGDYLPSVDAQWPEDSTEYNAFFEEIYIEVSEEWNEGTQTHEWGHHLLHHWTDPEGSDYCNGFCDAASPNPCNSNEPCDGNGGHCIWCNETDHDAWNEGFPNWLGSAVLRRWDARYGIAPWTRFTPPNADGRYTLETVQPCCNNPPGMLHNPWVTEGFVGAILRDIEDPAPEILTGPPWVCPQDSLAMTPRDILEVVRQAQPVRIIEFLQAFWPQHPERAHDIRNTALAVAPAYGNLWPTPPIQIYQAPSCRTVQVGQSLSLHVETNGSTWSLKMRWYRDGAPLSDTATRTGAFTDTLTITSASAADAGRYRLAIESCDGTQTLTSAEFPVFVFGDDGPGHKITGWGRNAFGSLGRGTLDPPTDSNPGDVVGLTNAVEVSAGYWNAVALLADGTVRSWGAPYLGDGTPNGSATPVAVSGLSNIVAVSAGGYATSMALDATGRVWTWGENYYGQIGDGIPGVRLTPVSVPGLDCVVDISMGAYSAAVVKADGSVWTWGSNTYGELGLGVSGGWYQTPQHVPAIDNAVEVECGWSHILIRRADGTVWASGSNAQGQLGDGTFTNRNTFGPVIGLTGITSVRAGALHSLAVRSDRTPWAWGYNGAGQLGNLVLGNVSTPLRPSRPEKVRSLDAGYYNSLFVDEEGTIWTCGYWAYGALGRPTNDYTPQPVDVRVGAAVQASAGIDFMMVVAPGARVTAPAVDQIAPGCSTTRLRISAVGQPPLNYHWRKHNGSNFMPIYDGGRISGAQTPELTIAGTVTDDTGLYDVLVWNESNITAGKPVVLVTPPLLQTFEAGTDPSAWWLSERGAWTLESGGYAAGAPGATPATYSSFRLPLTDFSIELDVVNASLVGSTTNSGIWLRSQLTGPQPSGVLFSLGDQYPWGTGDAYWLRWNGLSWQSPDGVAPGVYGEGDTVHVRVDVRGNVYTAHVNGAVTPTTQLATPNYPGGAIALFDNTVGPTLFDNILIQTLPSCPPESGLVPPSVVQYPLSQVVASGAPVALSVGATGSGPLSYQWLHNGVCIPSATSDIHAFTASNATSGRYECTVTNACGSVGSFPAIVRVDGGIHPGDINHDGLVDLVDVALFQAAFGRCAADPGWMHAADLDNSGCIDAADLLVLTASLGAQRL